MPDKFTLPETNIASENGRFGIVVSFWDGLFSGAMLVLSTVCFFLKEFE